MDGFCSQFHGSNLPSLPAPHTGSVAQEWHLMLSRKYVLDHQPAAACTGLASPAMDGLCSQFHGSNLRIGSKPAYSSRRLCGSGMALDVVQKVPGRQQLVSQGFPKEIVLATHNHMVSYGHGGSSHLCCALDIAQLRVLPKIWPFVHCTGVAFAVNDGEVRVFSPLLMRSGKLQGLV